MSHAVTRAELLDRVSLIEPVIRKHAEWGEQHGHLADAIVEALRDADLYRMLVPRELGGLEVAPLVFYQVVESLAPIDGSTGWCMFINGGGPFSTMFLRDEAVDAILNNDIATIMAGTVFPFGRAVPCAGGYRVSTHGVYASGCWHANWFLAACNIYEGGTAAPRGAGSACQSWCSCISREPR